MRFFIHVFVGFHDLYCTLCMGESDHRSFLTHDHHVTFGSSQRFGQLTQRTN